MNKGDIKKWFDDKQEGLLDSLETNSEFLDKNYILNLIHDCYKELSQDKPSIESILQNVEYHEQGMGCGLEDRGISNVYDAAEYGFNECLEQIAFQLKGLPNDK